MKQVGSVEIAISDGYPRSLAANQRCFRSGWPAAAGLLVLRLKAPFLSRRPAIIVDGKLVGARRVGRSSAEDEGAEAGAAALS
jgi:hypothetical protein